MRIEHEGWTLFDYDVKTGRQVWRCVVDGREVFRTDYPVDDVISLNTATRNMAQSGWKGDWHLVGSVPLNVYYDQLHDAVNQGDDKYLSRWLNDSDNSAWRTKSGRV